MTNVHGGDTCFFKVSDGPVLAPGTCHGNFELKKILEDLLPADPQMIFYKKTFAFNFKAESFAGLHMTEHISGKFSHHIKSRHSNVRLLAIQMPVLRHFSHDLELHVLSKSHIFLYVKS